MGIEWHRKPARESAHSFIRRQVCKDFSRGHIFYKVLDSVVVDDVFFAAVAKIDSHFAAVTVRAEVCLIKHDEDPNSQHPFGVKEMSEDADPVADWCPPRILGLLTPTVNENALTWRARCLARAINDLTSEHGGSLDRKSSLPITSLDPSRALHALAISTMA